MSQELFNFFTELLIIFTYLSNIFTFLLNYFTYTGIKPLLSFILLNKCVRYVCNHITGCYVVLSNFVSCTYII
jgi:hypothetical protein